MAVATIVSAVVVSCKKEKQEPLSNNTEQAVQSADNMDEYLISFKKKLLSAEKGGETISLEQAQRDLCNLLNFDFGDANYATDAFHYDTIHVNLILTNGQVELSQLAVSYNTLVNEILNTYQNTNLPEKSVYAISCVFNESESKNDDTKDIEALLITRGLNPQSGSHICDTNDWRPTNHGGMCDGSLQGYYGAPEIVMGWLNSIPASQFTCVNGGRLYFTEISDSFICGVQTYDNTLGNYRIYTSSIPNQSTVCLTHEVMVFYYNQILSYWNNGSFYPEQGENHIAIRFSIVHGLYNNLWSWFVTANHGIPNCTDSEPLV